MPWRATRPQPLCFFWPCAPRLALHVRKPFITEASDEAKRRGYIVNRTSGFYEEGKK